MTSPNPQYQGLADWFGPDALGLIRRKERRLTWPPVSPRQTTFPPLLGRGRVGGWTPATCVIPHGTLVPYLCHRSQRGIALGECSKTMVSGLQRRRHSLFHTERVHCAFHYERDGPRQSLGAGLGSAGSEGRHVVERRPNMEE